MFAPKAQTSAKAQAKAQAPPSKSAASAQNAKDAAQPPTETPFNPAWGRLALSIQPKPAVAAPDDVPGRKANRVADPMMRMAEPSSIRSTPIAIQRKCAGCEDRECAACEDEEKKTIRTKRAPSAHAEAPPDAEAAVRAADRSDAPLSKDLRSYFEPLFGHDFGGVRVHADRDAANAACAIQARAYTIGRDIVFGGGEYTPHTNAGKRLLAHELVHVVQQERGGSRLAPAGLSSPDDVAEREADSAAEAVVEGRAVAAGVHRKMHNKTILEPVRPDAKACLVHLHGEEHTAAAVAQELYGRRCVNYVHLDTDQGPLKGTNQRYVEFDVDVKGVNYTCTGDPNRVFSDKGRKVDATDGGTRCAPSPGADGKLVKKIKKNEIADEAASMLKTFVDTDWGAGISKCRGGSGTADLAGPLPVLALHNNEGGDRPSDAILTKYTGQWDEKDPRVAPDANPNYTADPKHPSDVFFVTDPKDYQAVKGTFNVGIQSLPVPPAGEDGSLSVALQKQRFINVEKQGRNHADLVDLGSGFKGHDAAYIKNYAMAVKALEVLNVPEGPCPGATPATVPPPTPTGAPTPQSPSPSAARPDGGAGPGKQDAEAAKADTEAKKKTEPYPLEKVGDADVPSKGCLHFDASSIGSRKAYWAAQITTLPVLDVVNWIVGAWNLDAKSPATMPSVVQAGVTESFRQRDCLLAAMKAGVKAQGGNVPAGNLMASGARSFQKQKEIWDDKWNFTGARARTFDRISKNAATKSAGLLTEGSKWDTTNAIHKLMWGVLSPAITEGDAMKFVSAGAASLSLQEREEEILMASSAPGVSRHHAGTDFDIGRTGTGKDELEPELWKPGETYFDLGRWLFHNAATWGFMRPFETKGGYGKGYMAEPWHWSYWPIAQALLEFARKNQQDVETELHEHWQKPGAGATKAQSQFQFVWGAWKDFLNNVDETPRF
jgi:hypothetical protein